jgi:2-iminobutanoate/2-iminopropanoate deaminase
MTPILPIPTRDAALAYTPAMLVPNSGRTLYISGQVAMDADGNVPPDFEAQARLVWHNIAAVLKAADMTMRDLVKITSFLLDPADFAINGRVRGEVLQGHKPASTLVYVSGLVRPEWRLEIEGVAVTAH